MDPVRVFVAVTEGVFVLEADCVGVLEREAV
jgi:hypothetical protein